MHQFIPPKDLTEKQRRHFRLAIVYSRWHEEIIQALLAGAEAAAHQKGLSKDQIFYFSVPGAYEIPQMVAHLAASKKYHAIAPIGCVIRGETNHYDLITNMVANSMDEIARSYHIPISFGLVTAENVSQAWDRAGGKKGNKAAEAVHAAIELASEMEVI